MYLMSRTFLLLKKSYYRNIKGFTMSNSLVIDTSISVIICAYADERWPKLVEAVRSLQKQAVPAKEIIVVIDHNQKLLERAHASFSAIQVIPNREQRGLSGARNSGVAAASGALLAFLDDDAAAEPDWLQSMQAAFVDSAVLGVGTAVVPDWQTGEPSWFPTEFQWVVGCTYLGMPRVNAPIRNPVGASMCIRQEVFQQVGGFRNGIGRVGTLPIGCEETELCIRARHHWPERFFLYLPQAQVSHYVPGERATWRYFAKRCYAEGISKAAIARFVGAKDSLSSERSYTLQTLPVGILRNLSAVLRRRQLAGMARGAAIVLGLGITTVGYILGKCMPLAIAEDTNVIIPKTELRGKQEMPV